MNEIRENEKTGISLKTAIGRAIASMPESYVIKAFIDKHRAEVEGMLDTEYSEAEVLEIVKYNARKEGQEEGREEERANTERERARADAECKRADAAEERIKILEAKLAESIR